MKSFTATLLLLCAAALCITATAAVPKTKTKLQGSHMIQKRQVSPGVVCSAPLVSDACTNGRIQEIVDTNDQCNDPDSNQELQDSCRRNSQGLFCGGEAQVLAEKFEVDTSTTCDVSQDCSPACRNLILDARNRLGCCINIFNNSDSSVPRQYSNSLWSSCSVDRVTQQCSQSTINLRTVPVDPTCDSTAFSERSQSIDCRRDYVNSARDALSDIEECEDLLDIITINCNANRDRTYCSSLSLSGNFSEARSNCADTSTCDPRCIETLTNITNTVGCCFMDRYNTTYEYGWLGYEFWSRCGLESPGLCEEYLNNAVTLKASSAVITFAVTAAVLLLWTAMM